MNGDAGIRVLLIVLGFWIVMRSVNKDASGRTLIDHILGQAGGANQQLPASTGGSSGYVAGASIPGTGGARYATPTGGGVGALAPDLTKLAGQHGWNAADVTDWEAVINRESGGNQYATNSSTGAYGIAQMLGSGGSPSNMGPNYQKYYSYGGNPNTVWGQLVAMANYIKERYGSPAGALAHENSYGWY